MSYCVTDGDEPAKAPEAKKKRAGCLPYSRAAGSEFLKQRAQKAGVCSGATCCSLGGAVAEVRRRLVRRCDGYMCGGFATGELGS